MGLEKKLSNLFVYSSIIIFALVLFLYLIFNNYIYIVFALFIALFISRSSKIKHFGLILFLVSFLVRLVFVIVADFPQIYDFETLLTASHMFAAGDYSFSEWWHFATWGYQTGFVIYQGVLLKLFNSVFLLKLLNVIYSSCLVYFIYYVSKRISDEKSARFVSLLYMIFPFYIFMDIILANHHLASLLMYIGILFLIKNNKCFKDYVFGGIFLALGNIIRPEGIIVVLSFLLFEFFTLDREKIYRTVVRVLSFLIIYFSIGYTASFLVIKSGVNPSGLENKDPLWKFILGFNYDSCGYYDDSDSQYQINRETELSIIKERALGNLPRTGKLMLCKINRFWLSPGLNFETGSYRDKVFNLFGIKVEFSLVEDIVTDFNGHIQIFALVMFFIGIFVNRKKLSNDALFFLIMCVITFFVFLFIEIQPRYAYFIHVSIFILGSMGVKFIIDYVDRLKIFKSFKKN